MKKISVIISIILCISLLFGCSHGDRHKGEAKIPTSNAYILDLNYKDAVEQFETAGFKNIDTEKIEDLVTGWIYDDGEVESISINGDKNFIKERWISNDAHVLIRYHTFPEKKSDNKKEETKEVTESKKKDNTSSVLKVCNCDLTKAKRAAIVAITNGYADDVLKSDYETIDPAKLHSYSDLSGYYMTVIEWGDWTVKDKKTWHAEDMLLNVYTSDLKIKVDGIDVSYDGKKYVVSNLEGKFNEKLDLSGLEEEYKHPDSYLNVSPKLVEKDRDKDEEEALDKSDVLNEFTAQNAFTNYGKNKYRYGFKCHWTTDLIAAKQDKSTGAWFFKVGVTIKNEYGTKMKATAEGTVRGTNDNTKVENFYVY